MSERGDPPRDVLCEETLPAAFFLLPFLAGSGICSLPKVIPSQLSKKFGVSSSSVKAPRQLELAAFENQLFSCWLRNIQSWQRCFFIFFFDAQSPGGVLLVLTEAGRNEGEWRINCREPETFRLEKSV